MSMYIGIQVFGVLGILILPITVVIVKTLNDEEIIHLWDPKGGEKISGNAETKSSEKSEDAVHAEKEKTSANVK